MALDPSNGPHAGPMLAHKAYREAEVAAEAIAGKASAFDPRCIPAVIFTDPEIACAGLQEHEARAQGRDVLVGRFAFAANGRALGACETDGFVKAVIGKDDHHLLGVGIVGPHASDLVSEAALAIEMGAHALDVGLTIHPQPTLPASGCPARRAGGRRAPASTGAARGPRDPSASAPGFAGSGCDARARATRLSPQGHAR